MIQRQIMACNNNRDDVPNWNVDSSSVQLETESRHGHCRFQQPLTSFDFRHYNSYDIFRKLM
jgi:hypothetical protein